MAVITQTIEENSMLLSEDIQIKFKSQGFTAKQISFRQENNNKLIQKVKSAAEVEADFTSGVNNLKLVRYFVCRVELSSRFNEIVRGSSQ